MPIRIPWRTFSISHLAHLRTFSTARPLSRDLTAKYRYRPRPPDTYLTSSTTPVTSSIQAVPPPSDDAVVEKVEGEPVGARKATVLPVMMPLHQEDVKPVPDKRSKELRVAGVVLPPKPSPPESDECCMSGCVNCVYTVYADDLLAYNESLTNAISALLNSAIPRSEWPEEVVQFYKKGAKRDDAAAFGSARKSGDEVVEKVTREEIMRDVLVDVDPALRAFLDLPMHHTGYSAVHQAVRRSTASAALQPRPITNVEDRMPLSPDFRSVDLASRNDARLELAKVDLELRVFPDLVYRLRNGAGRSQEAPLYIWLRVSNQETAEDGRHRKLHPTERTGRTVTYESNAVDSMQLSIQLIHSTHSVF
ncbi:hypothetical protein QFC20_003185 [Naganishia adeliensis]|uniref:Uncharacterized protein n=1 Tax=Naganishia adeliensis TaxID=92952 RepID=A0ACC2WF69_9TREE|nr:hypothetical protein QFC20_003185 [Naganishia adeliensis]